MRFLRSRITAGHGDSHYNRPIEDHIEPAIRQRKYLFDPNIQGILVISCTIFIDRVRIAFLVLRPPRPRMIKATPCSCANCIFSEVVT